MKRSEIYFLAQMAVLLSGDVKDEDKLIILRELMLQEEIWLGYESQNEKENAE